MGGVGGTGKAKRPIGVKFEIPYFTTSGIQVRYLKIIEPKVSLCRTVAVTTILTDCNSCNILRYPGCGTSHRVAILRSDYPTCKAERMRDFVRPFEQQKALVP